MSKSPAFQFYPADFLADENVVLMTNRELGCYIKLMCYCWREGSIPADVSKLAKLCGEDGSAMADLWIAIGSCFASAIDDPSRLVHPRLVVELEKQREHKKERSESGKKGAKARWGAAPSGNCSSMAEPMAKPLAKPIAKNGSSSSSSSSTSVEEKNSSSSKRKTSLTEDFVPPPNWMAKATDYGMTDLTFQNEIGKFNNHHIGKGTTSSNWLLQWDTWCRQWVGYGARQVQPGGHSPPLRTVEPIRNARRVLG